MKQFKTLIPFRHNIHSLVEAAAGKTKFLDALETSVAAFPIRDPAAGSWNSIGFLGNEAGDMLYANESAVLLMVSIRERILPGPVIKAEVKRRAQRLEDRQGRKCNRKELAQLRDDAEAHLLPKSHIKETFIPVILRQKWVMVCTSSHKRAEEVVSLLCMAIGESGIFAVETVQDPAKWMTEVAVNGESEDGGFWPGESINLIGHDEAKGTVSFRNEDVTSDRVTGLLTNEGYTATRMQVCTEDMRFTLSSNLAITGIKFNDTFMEEHTHADKDDVKAVFDSNLTMVALAYHELLRQLVTDMGGLREPDAAVKEDLEQVAETARKVAEDMRTIAADAGLTLNKEGFVGRKLTFWQDSDSGEVFVVRSSRPEPDADVAVQITLETFELEGGDVTPEDAAWARGEGPFEDGEPNNDIDQDDEDDDGEL